MFKEDKNLNLFNYSRVPEDDEIFTIKILALNAKRKNFRYINVEFTSTINPDIKLSCCIVEQYNILLFLALLDALPNGLKTSIPEEGLEIPRKILVSDSLTVSLIIVGNKLNGGVLCI